MISKNCFCEIIRNLKSIIAFGDKLSDAIGGYEISLDAFTGGMMDALVEEIQDYLDEDVGDSNIDVGEIFSVWFCGMERPNGYLVKIDSDEYDAATAEQIYNLFETIKERLATAENIYYATTA